MAGTDDAPGKDSRMTSSHSSGYSTETPSYDSSLEDGGEESNIMNTGSSKTRKKYNVLEKKLYKGQGSGLGEHGLSLDLTLNEEELIIPQGDSSEVETNSPN